MIVQLAIFKELFSPFLISLFVATTLLMLDKGYRLLLLVVQSRLQPKEFGLMLAFLTPQVLTITLPLAVVGAVFATVIRHSTESELIALRAAGRSVWNYLVPYIVFGLVTAIATAIVTLWVQPAFYSRYVDFQLQMVRYRAEEKIVTGEFNTDFGDKVILVQGRVARNRFHSIFIGDQIMRTNSPVITAQYGTISVDEDSRQVVMRLESGRIYLTDKDPSLVRVVDFGQMNYHLSLTSSQQPEINTLWAVSTKDLWRELGGEIKRSNRRIRGGLEFATRFATPLSCIGFAITAVPMAIVDPRSRQSGSFVKAITMVSTFYLIWVAFSNLVYSGMSDPTVLLLPAVLISLFGLMRIWAINSNVDALRAVIRWVGGRRTAP